MSEWPGGIRWRKGKWGEGRNTWSLGPCPALPKAGGPTFVPGGETRTLGMLVSGLLTVSSFWTWPFTVGCFGDSTLPNVVTVPVVCVMDSLYKTWIVRYFIFPFFLCTPPFCSLEWSTAMQSSAEMVLETITMTHYSPEDDRHFHLPRVLGHVVLLFFSSLSHLWHSMALYSLKQDTRSSHPQCCCWQLTHTVIHCLHM